MRWLVLGLFGLSVVLTGFYRKYALSRQILDIPNQRSAHTTPVPRGAGVVFVVLFLAVMGWTMPMQWVPLSCLFGVACLGYWDDKVSIAAHYRILIQTGLCVSILIYLHTIPDLEFGAWRYHWGMVSGIVLGTVFLVWMLNLYNFMDGINGLAGFEAICVCVGIVLVCHWAPVSYDTQPLMMLAAVVLGFLIWNFPYAKVFMGDAGSGFLGLLLGVWSLQAGNQYPPLLWSWLILLGVFMVDATLTLCRRFVRKQALHIAHASHAYQHATRRLGSHWKVTLSVVSINVVWLWPIAVSVGAGYLPGMLGLILAYSPLVVLAYYFQAGENLE